MYSSIFGLCWFKCQTGIGWELLQISSLIPLLGTTYYFGDCPTQNY